VTTRIAILVEGATEAAFRPVLLHYLQQRLAGSMPKLDFAPQDGRLAKTEKLRRQVGLLLKTNDAVIALTDVYTGTRPPDFANADDARKKMQEWVGAESRFYPHAAQYEFEAWLLPYWSTIQALARSNRTVPAPNPESVNHQKPPSKHLDEVFRTGQSKRSYVKTRDAVKILRGQDLAISAAACPELKAFLNTILTLSGGPPL
jgi:Domain of unknown function (DUF4276)